MDINEDNYNGNEVVYHSVQNGEVPMRHNSYDDDDNKNKSDDDEDLYIQSSSETAGSEISGCEKNMCVWVV